MYHRLSELLYLEPLWYWSGHTSKIVKAASDFQRRNWTSSVAAGFGRHGMPPPTSSTWHRYSMLFPEWRRSRDKTYRRRELMTLTFDLGGHREQRLSVIRVWVLCQSTKCKFHTGQTYHVTCVCNLVTLVFNLGDHGACRWCGSTSSICTPTLKFLDLTVRKIWHVVK